MCITCAYLAGFYYKNIGLPTKTETNEQMKVTLFDLLSQNYVVTSLLVVLPNFAKFGGNVKIPWQHVNSAAWLETPWPAENCGPYLFSMLITKCLQLKSNHCSAVYLIVQGGTQACTLLINSPT